MHQLSVGFSTSASSNWLGLINCFDSKTMALLELLTCTKIHSKLIGAMATIKTWDELITPKLEIISYVLS